jgi:predicted DNA-binding transcriptional regulator YafY
VDVLIDYTNYKGERALRHVIPINLWHGTTEHHPHPGWLLQAYAMDRDGAVRDFSMDDIHSWRAYDEAAA